jgi:hypothetical protein
VQWGLSSEPDIKIFPLPPADSYILVLGSDGVWDFVSPEDVEAHLRVRGAAEPLAVRVDTLCDLAQERWIEKQRHYVDDITCVAIEFVGPEPEAPVVLPASVEVKKTSMGVVGMAGALPAPRFEPPSDRRLKEAEAQLSAGLHYPPFSEPMEEDAI